MCYSLKGVSRSFSLEFQSIYPRPLTQIHYYSINLLSRNILKTYLLSCHGPPSRSLISDPGNIGTIYFRLVPLLTMIQSHMSLILQAWFCSVTRTIFFLTMELVLILSPYPFTDERFKCIASEDTESWKRTSITKLLASPDRDYLINRDNQV